VADNSGIFYAETVTQKTRGRFPGAGAIGAVNCCEDDNVPVICPTCQIFLKRLPKRRRNLSATYEFA
jgi:hypothetical protein